MIKTIIIPREQYCKIEVSSQDRGPRGSLLSTMVDYFLQHHYEGSRPIRILEIGANPMILEKYLKRDEIDISTEREKAVYDDVMRTVNGLGMDNLRYPPASRVSQILDTIVCANDIKQPPAIVNWLDAKFVEGNFLDEKVRESIVGTLGGEPDLILGMYVFIPNIGFYLRNQNSNITIDKPEWLGEQLSYLAWEILKKGGHILVDNTGAGSNPAFFDVKTPVFEFEDRGAIYKKPEG